MDRSVSEFDGYGGTLSRPTPVFAEAETFGSNPGNLRMQLYVPDSRRRRRPLVVVLHGCSQTARGFDRGAGWTALAALHDFLVLMPEQRVTNNQRACFSWFQPEDTTRGFGEVESIRQMVVKTIADHGVDTKQVFICGLSAGGAMTGAMLATYPELFAGGAIVAGLPYGTASDVAEAVESMQIGRVKEARIWGDAIRAASDARRDWPTVAIWQGTADNVVKPINAGELVKQWTNVHGVNAETPAEDHLGRIIRRVWTDKRGRACVSEYSVPGLGHGFPVADSAPPAPFFLPAGISATHVIARDWGLTDSGAQRKPRVFRTAFWRTPS